MATTGKLMEVYFENAIDTYNKQSQLLPLVNLWEPDSGTMQNAGNTVWRNVEQHSPIIKGWDMTGLETDIIEETCPFNLGLPNNDIYKQRADDLRTRTFWENRGQATAKRQAAELNRDIMLSVQDAGSLYFETNAVSGFDAIGEAQAMMNERQGYGMERTVVLNDRDTLKYAKDLAGRGTVKGRPETDAWQKGQIGENVAEFDVYTGSYLGAITGNVGGDSTTTAILSFKPEGGTVNTATNTVTNIDYRTATIPVAASAGYAVGDYVKFDNAGKDVEAVGLNDKTATGTAMTFKIVAIANGTTIEVFPKPIAIDDAGLTSLEQAYGNIDTQIGNGANVIKLNNFAGTRKSNIFFSKDSIEVVGGDAPIELMNEYGGMKVITSSLENGLKAYLVYDGDMITMQFRARFFVWYGVTNANPMENGVFTTL